MRVKTIVFTRFNRVFEDKEKNPRYKKTLGNPDWWDKRAVLMQETFLPSLAGQIDTNFETIAVFSDFLNKIDPLPVTKLCWNSDVRLVYERFGNKTLSFIPYTHLVDRRDKADYDYFRLVNIDSDDAIRNWVMRDMADIEPKDGRVVWFDNGFIYRKATDELSEYHAHNAPPSFFAMDFPVSVLGSNDSAFEYIQRHGMDVEHYNTNRCAGSVRFSDWAYLHIDHSANTTLDSSAHNTKKHIGRKISGEEKKEVLQTFNIKNG